jgi:hypothetical protein
MANMSNVVQQLKKERDRAAREVKRFDAALAALGSLGKGAVSGTMSAEGRARISAAQKARWAKTKGTTGSGTAKVVSMPKRTMSPAAKKKIAEAQRARWAKVRAAKKA